jgi:hypothetical protein
MSGLNIIFDDEDPFDDFGELTSGELAGCCRLSSPWRYVIILKNGWEFEFLSLEANGDYARLRDVQRAENASGVPLRSCLGKESIDVRVSRISYVTEFIRD